MSLPILHEPGKIMSAAQAAVIMLAMIAPLLWSVNFRRPAIPVTLAVPLLASSPAPPPAPAVEPATSGDVKQLREQLERTRSRQIAADVARKKEKRKRREQEEKEKRLERERAQAERDRQEAEREKLEAERREEEQDRNKKLAQEQLEREKSEEQERWRETREKTQIERDKLERERQSAESEAELQSLLQERRDDMIRSYVRRIQQQIRRHTSNPRGVAQDIYVLIRVPLNRNGTLSGLPVIVEPSGNQAYDDQAYRAVIRAGQEGFALPKDPELLDDFDELVLRITPQQ